MSTYAPDSSVVVSGADRNYGGIPDALQGSYRILTNGDVSPRRIVERDLSPNRTITGVISPTSAPKGACLTAQQQRWIIVGFLLAAMGALVALLWPRQLVMEKIVSVDKCPVYGPRTSQTILYDCLDVKVQKAAKPATAGDYCSTPCQSWRGHVELRWCAFENTGLALESAGLEGGGPALDSGAWGWCSETQDGKKLCPLQTGLAFLQEEPAWTDIECSSHQVCLEANAEDPKRACATERVVSVDTCPSYEPHCGNALQPGATVGDYCSIACQHWHGNKDMRWCPTGADHGSLANTKWGWCKEAEA